MVQSMQLRIQRLVQELQQQQQQNPNTPANPAYKEDADLFGNSAGWMLSGFFVGGFAVAIPLRRTSLLLRLPLTMVGSTVGGQVGMMYGAMRTVKSTLETERRSVISDDILCPALAELKPCLNDRNCMEVMKVGTRGLGRGWLRGIAAAAAIALPPPSPAATIAPPPPSPAAAIALPPPSPAAAAARSLICPANRFSERLRREDHARVGRVVPPARVEACDDKRSGSGSSHRLCWWRRRRLRATRRRP